MRHKVLKTQIQIHKELTDQLLERCALVLLVQDMLHGGWKEKCGSLAKPDDVMIRLMHTGGLEVTLRHAHNSEISQKHVYQLPFMSRLLHHNESVRYCQAVHNPLWTVKAFGRILWHVWWNRHTLGKVVTIQLKFIIYCFHLDISRPY